MRLPEPITPSCTVPPTQAAPYAAAHDEALWDTLLRCLGGSPPDGLAYARDVAGLPAAMGGLGLCSASRVFPAAYWAGWADALTVIQTRRAGFAEARVAELSSPAHGCGRRRRPEHSCKQKVGLLFHDLLEGARPQHNDQAVGLGDWPHGWQFHASRIRHSHFCDCVLLPSLPPSLRALLRSQAGAEAGAWLTAIPADVSTALSPGSMQVALRRRMRLPLPIAPNRCGGEGPGCKNVADAFGDHALACPQTGLLARRAKVVERAWVRVAREAVGPEGQVVQQQWLAHTTAVGVDARDRRRLDLVIYGVSPRGEALCCDATLVSPLTRSGTPQPRASEEDGAALRVAERRKRATYPELLAQGRSGSWCLARR